MIDNNLLTVKQIIEAYPDFNAQKINFYIRNGKLKAKKIGTKHYVNRNDLYEFLGIDSSNNTNEMKKMVEKNKMLETELDIYKKKYNRIKIFLETAYKEII